MQNVVLDKRAAIRIQAWENQYLRKVFRLRRREEESRQNYFRRTSAWINKSRRENGFQSISQRLVERVFDEGWNENNRANPQARGDIMKARRYRDYQWRVATFSVPAAKRSKHENTLRATRGKPQRQFEDLLVDVLGERWQELRNECDNISAWRKRTLEDRQNLMAFWGLPWIEPKTVVKTEDRAPVKEAIEAISAWAVNLGDLRDRTADANLAEHIRAW